MIGKERQNGATVIGGFISLLGSRVSNARVKLIITFITITTVYLWRLTVVSAKQLSLTSFGSIQRGFQIFFVHLDDRSRRYFEKKRASLNSDKSTRVINW